MSQRKRAARRRRLNAHFPRSIFDRWAERLSRRRWRRRRHPEYTDDLEEERTEAQKNAEPLKETPRSD